jgi:hypothetical protein
VGVCAFRGRNNNFFIQSQGFLALNYNDKAVLENFHLASTFKALSENPELNVWRSLSAADFKRFRERVIAMVLATDMARHFPDFNKFKSLVEEEGFSFNGPSRDFIMEQILHYADLINPAKPFKIAQEWAERICSEFYSQGDEERAMSLPVSFGCNKYEKDLSEFQVSFINGIILPMFKTLTLALPNIQDALVNIESNQKEWVSLKEHYAAIHRKFPQLFLHLFFFGEKTEKICSK